MIKKIRRWASRLYALGVRVWLWSYRAFPGRRRKAGARVISVGNITWGGTGKTPVVIRLAQRFADQGQKVAVLTRGYGGGDEVAEMKKALGEIPVLVGRDRARIAEQAVRQFGAQVLLLDDGFQHLPIQRDVDLVLINTTVPFGPGGLIPEGTLREPVENLSRADHFILTQANIGSKNVHWIRQKLQAIKPNAVFYEATHRPVGLYDPWGNRRQDVAYLQRKKVAAISAIGDPYSFEKSVEWLGAEVPLAARFEDHHAFSADEIVRFVARAKELGLKEAVTTEKDQVRLEAVRERVASRIAPFTFWVLQIEAEIHDEEDLIRRCLHP